MVSITAFLAALLAAQTTAPHENSATQQEIAAIFNDLGIAGFHIRKTKHFLIGYDTSEDFIRPHVGRLEGIHAAVARFCEVNGFNIDESEELLPIVFFDKFDSFARCAKKMRMPSEGIAGFYHQRNNVAAFVNASDLPPIRAIADRLQVMHERLAEAKGTGRASVDPAAMEAIENVIYSASAQRDSLVEVFNRFVLQHEAAHQILFDAGVHARLAATPQWLVEGLACQFEVPQADRSGRLQRVNQMRLADLREAMGLPAGANSDFKVDAERLIADGKLIPLRQLAAGREVFQAGDQRLKLSYAEGWGLVLYLYRTSPAAFRDYLHTLSKREPGTPPDPERDLAEFESAFGAIDIKFEQSWADFITHLHFEP